MSNEYLHGTVWGVSLLSFLAFILFLIVAEGTERLDYTIITLAFLFIGSILAAFDYGRWHGPKSR